ncbi:MAG: hypothetical protein RL544_1879 [Bacteroidota bacterium]|jgi:hypothetical protein
MEVHHHSHHPKKWKEYVTEFLMLFLAVSNEEFTMLAKTYHYRQERLTVGLRYQIQLQEHGAALLKLLEPKYQH